MSKHMACHITLRVGLGLYRLQQTQISVTHTVAYLECAKGGGPGGLGDGSPPVGSRGKAPVGGLGASPRS